MLCTGTKKELEKTMSDFTKNLDGLSSKLKGIFTFFNVKNQIKSERNNPLNRFSDQKRIGRNENNGRDHIN